MCAHLIQDFDAIPQTFRIVVRIALRHDRQLVPEQPLELVEIHACLNKSCGEGMPEIVEVKIVDPGLP
jgi:hypothetical protein